MVRPSVDTQPISRTYRSAGFRYRACRPDEYLVKSGMGVKEEVVARKTFQWPFSVFTIGPYNTVMDANGFKRYASKMSAMSALELQEVVLGVVYGQTRLYAAGLTVLQMFNDRDSFKMHVQERIAKELISFGLQVFNGNVAEMRDSEGNAYFSSLKQKAISGAVDDARVATASAKKVGDIGESERQAEAKISMAEISANVTEQENIRHQQIAKSKLELDLVNLECEQQEETQHVQAQMAPKQLQAELQTKLNKLDGMKQHELLRATDLAKTVVNAEDTIKDAEAKAAAQRQLADAQLYTEQQRAEGMKATSEAQAEGLRKILTVADTDLVKFYLAVENGLFEKLASKTADAVRGMAPKIHIWNTGPEGSGDAYGPLQKLFTSLPPMLNAVQSQTDIPLPQLCPQEVSAATSSLMPPPA